METVKSYINKITLTKIWYYIENLLVISLLFYCIYSLIGYDNAYYQVWKNQSAVKAILSFTAIVFIIRKVKLFNWQSLIVTLLFGLIVIERLHYWQGSADILDAVIPQLVAEWFSLMIIIDMLLYKNISDIFGANNYLLYLYIALTIGMLIRRHDRLGPIVLIFPMFLFALVKMNSERKQWFICRFIDSWFLAFVYVVLKSFIEHPYEGEQYYGCFVNIGQFGIFMVCCFTIAIISIFYTKERYSRLSLPYFISWTWLLISSYMLYIIDTRTVMAGILLCLVGLFLFKRKNISKAVLIKRILLLLVLFFGIIVFYISAVNICNNISEEWLLTHSSGIWVPISTSIKRFQWVAYMELYHPTGNRMFDILDALSSSRLTIWKRYSEYFNFDGNPSIGFELYENGYWVYTAHNTYVQFLVEYGYISFTILLFTICYSIVKSINYYIINGKQVIFLLPIIWFFSLLGVWLGESNTFFFPITFFGFMFIALSLQK